MDVLYIASMEIVIFANMGMIKISMVHAFKMVKIIINNVVLKETSTDSALNVLQVFISIIINAKEIH